MTSLMSSSKISIKKQFISMITGSMRAKY